MTGRGTRALALCGLAAAAGIAGCGGGDGGGKADAALQWKQPPKVFVLKDLPSDRVLLAVLKNDSDRTRRLVARDIVVRDAGGRTLRSSAGFRNGISHGLYGAFQQPAYISVSEATRLGQLRNLTPGAETPIYVAWRENEPLKRPITVLVGGQRLRVPDRASSAP